MTNTMRGLLINPNNRTVTDVEVPKGLQGLYAALRQGDGDLFSGTVELVRLAPHVDLWIDEEGNLSDGRRVFQFYGQRYSGAALLLGNDGASDSTELHQGITRDQVYSAIEWTPLMSSGDFGPSHTEDGAAGFVFVCGSPIYRTMTEEETAELDEAMAAAAFPGHAKSAAATETAHPHD